MKECPRREGIYDSVKLCNVSELIIEIEEHGLDALPFRGDLPREEQRVGDCNIADRSADTAQQEVRLYHGAKWSAWEEKNDLRTEKVP